MGIVSNGKLLFCAIPARATLSGGPAIHGIAGETCLGSGLALRPEVLENDGMEVHEGR
jgi:hypothetical protein